MARGTRGAYRKEDRVALPANLQKELVEKAAAKFGSCQELAKRLDIPKSSAHYYRIGRLTMPVSVLEAMLRIAGDEDLRKRVSERGIEKDRSWATEYAQDVFREMCRDKVRLPTKEELKGDDDLRRKAAAIVSYVLAEGSVWIRKDKCNEACVNITFADHEDDLYNHFRGLCREVFLYDMGPSQPPGNGARAIRGFIYSRFAAEWFVDNGVFPGEKSSKPLGLPKWIMNSDDPLTWISALQPWCDGEGSVGPSSFNIVQSRHTTLDADIIPRSAYSPTRACISKGFLKSLHIHGTTVYDYCVSNFPIEVMMDIRDLFARLDFHSRLDIVRLALKMDGCWSCVWAMYFNKRDALRLLDLGLVTQERKKRLLADI